MTVGPGGGGRPDDGDRPRCCEDIADTGRGLAATVAGLADQTGVVWGVCVRDLGTGRVLASLHPDQVLPIASVGKLLLLVEVATRIADGTLDPAHRLRRRAELAVGDSGLWQHLTTDALPVGDLAVLVAAVSDNLATNLLLDHVGLDAVQQRGESLGLSATRLLDRVRDQRGSHQGRDVPPTLARGAAGELCELLARLSWGTAVAPEPDTMVLDWLGLGVDLSMIGAALGLDPLTHRTAGNGWRLHAKTGSDPGIRADVGLLGQGRRQLAYAAIACWDPGDGLPRDAVLENMARLGHALRAMFEVEVGR